MTTPPIAELLAQQEAEETPPENRPLVVTMSDVKATKVRWLWDKRIPRGKLMIIAGEPGDGKSTLTMDVAARITTATAWPDGSLPCGGDVLLLSAEDTPSDTIKPRLDAAGADCSRVHLLRAIQQPDGEERNFNLTRDLEPLKLAIEQYHPILVCIDPINAYLGETDEWRDTSVKKALLPLVKLAETYECAIVAVTHLSKSQGRKALHRVMGSIGYTGTARHVMAVAADPEDHDLRYFVWVKSNAGPPSETLGFRIDDAQRIAWEPTPATGITADAIMSGFPGDPSESKDAKEFLQEELADGEWIESKKLISKAREVGINSHTLQNAGRRLGVEKKRIGFGSGGVWNSRLPRSS